MTFSVFNFPVRIESSAGIVALIWLSQNLRANDPLPLAIAGVLVMFLSVLWHELGHAQAARMFRLHPIDISLHGMGGLTRHRPSDRAWKDLLVTLAGPGNGLVLGILCLVALPFVKNHGANELLQTAAAINLFWSVFNMLPMFPMDGGSALYSTLRMFLPRYARTVTGGVGIFVALLIAAWGISRLLNGSGWAMITVWFAASSAYQCWNMLTAEDGSRAR